MTLSTSPFGPAPSKYALIKIIASLTQLAAAMLEDALNVL